MDSLVKPFKDVVARAIQGGRLAWIGVLMLWSIVGCAMQGPSTAYPTKGSINSEVKRFSNLMQVDTKHIKGFEDIASHRGSLFVVQLPERNLCAVIANKGHYSSSYVMKFMNEFPGDGAGHAFAVAHEITHCLFDREKSLVAVQQFLPDIKDPGLASELLADATGLVYLKQSGWNYMQALSVLQRHRKWNVVSTRYNTGEHLNEQLLASIEKEIFFFNK